MGAHSFCVLGGEIGTLLERLLRHQIDTLTIERVEGETRINGTAIEHQPAAQYEIAGIGPAIPPASLKRLLDTFISSTGQGFGVLTGSIQIHDDHFYARQVEQIHAHGGRAVVDAEGALLRHAVQAHPFLIKPNRYELEQLTQSSIGSIEDAAIQARKLQQAGTENVCVSMGPQGAVFCNDDGCYHAVPPKVRVNSTVGAGDTMVAALIAGLSEGKPVREVLRMACACSAGTVTRPGTELFDPDELAQLMDKTVVHRLDI